MECVDENPDNLRGYDIILCSHSVLRAQYNKIHKLEDWGIRSASGSIHSTSTAAVEIPTQRARAGIFAKTFATPGPNGIFCLLVDEAHLIKEDTLTAEAILRLKFSYTITVSGTPIANNIIDVSTNLSLFPNTGPCINTQHFLDLFVSSSQRKYVNEWSTSIRSKLFHLIIAIHIVARPRAITTQHLGLIRRSCNNNIRDKRLLLLIRCYITDAKKGLASQNTALLVSEQASGVGWASLQAARRLSIHPALMGGSKDNGEISKVEHNMNSKFLAWLKSSKLPENTSLSMLDDDQFNILWKRWDDLKVPSERATSDGILNPDSASPKAIAMDRIVAVVESGEMSPRLAAIYRVIKAILQDFPGEKVIIGAHLIDALELTYLFLQKQFADIDTCFMKFTGSMIDKDRKNSLAKFANSSAKLCILFISYNAGGVGLNLQAASHVVMVEPMWNDAEEDQLFSRARRIGQTRTVTAWEISVPNSEFDKYMDTIRASKEVASSQFTQLHYRCDDTVGNGVLRLMNSLPTWDEIQKSDTRIADMRTEQEQRRTRR